MGHEVIMTRVTDETLSLSDRTNILNKARCDFCVSVHVNSHTTSSPNYISTFIQGIGGEAEKLAKYVQPRLVQATDWEDGGVRVTNLHMTRETDMPAILVELGFISNPDQESQLRYVVFRRRLAKAIALGVLEYTGGPIRQACTINIKGKEFPGWLSNGVSYFDKELQIPVREIVEAIAPAIEWNGTNMTVMIK
jgi:N-acetylmuramoyl-L-alanine amidase